jgi:nucleoid-associated protein YgaU
MWSADLGNGYYGGLQMSHETWQQFGGTQYAPTADLASRSQQIAVAEKVLDAQGPTVWATCAALAGLTNDGAAAGVDPGALESPLPSTPAEPTPSVEPTAPAAPDPVEDSGADGGSGKHRGAPEQTTEPGGTDSERESGRHASRGDGATREGVDGARGADAEPGEYAVRPGESLWSIADDQKVAGGWMAIYEANRKVIGDDPDHILPGQSLDLDLN